jgi:hypothetical protein
MWKLKIVLFGVLIMVFCTGLHGQSRGYRFAEDNLDEALLWMFEKGIPQYYSGVSNKEICDLLYKEIGSGIFSNSIRPNEPWHILSFILTDVGKSKKTNDPAPGIHYYVNCYLRDIQDDNVIEYWVIKRQISARSRNEPVFDRCLFKITVADTIHSSRVVEVESDSFIDSVEVSGRTIRFPKDNLYILYSLDARRWPKSYTNSDLDEYIVKFKKNGEPYLKKINWFLQIWWGIE